MTPVVLFILAVVWAIYLASWYRSRSDRHGVNSISSFARHLSVLERTSPVTSGRAEAAHGRLAPRYAAPGSGAGLPPMSLDAARRRRRNVLVSLAGVAVGALVLMPFLGGLAVAIEVVTLLLLGAYVTLLVRTQRLATERRAKVRYLHPVGTAQAEPVGVARQSVI